MIGLGTNGARPVFSEPTYNTRSIFWDQSRNYNCHRMAHVRQQGGAHAEGRIAGCFDQYGGMTLRNNALIQWTS